MRPGSRRRDRGFTLVELAAVILIIGLMMSFLLVAAWEGVRRAEERATQALILKLDAALADRIEALTQQRPRANLAHRYLSMTQVPGTPVRFLESEDRARLIARVDYLRRELPDVFFVQDDDLYPLNFAGMAFHPQTASPIGDSNPIGTLPASYAPYILPLGHGLYSTGSFDDDGVYSAASLINWRTGGNSRAQAGEGIFGASYSAMGAITRQLGYHQLGYNGADDNNNGLIDELAEGINADDPVEPGLDGVLGTSDDITRSQLIATRLANHRHITARSEMLYAILVGGAGPLGSVFSADDFTDRDVRDTDGDGLLEFVDAWGRPLQFYRWPVYYTTDLGSLRSFQKGSAPYQGRTDTRDQNSLDPNQLFVSPSWWMNLSNIVDDPGQMSARANLFQQHFFSLIDPNAAASATSAQGQLWDRNGFFKRRSYFSKFLIASSGPDKQLGIGSYGLRYDTSGQSDAVGYQVDRSSAPRIIPVADRDKFTARLILIENQASRSDPHARPPGTAGTLSIDDAGAGPRALYQDPSTGSDPLDATTMIRDQWGADDITNQTLNAPGTGVR